jgi:hypothetical protein
MSNEDYDKREAARNKDKLEKLESFERTVRTIVENLYLAVVWSWAILGIACPVLVYFHPLPQDPIIQGLIFAGIFWILFAMAHAMKAIGRIDKS